MRTLEITTAANPALPTTVSQFTDDRQDADTYGWDTAFALHFAEANKAITNGWSQVDAGAKNMTQVASDDSTFHIDTTLGPWQLCEGGDGKNVRMLVPIATGSYTGGAHVYDLTGVNMQVLIEVGMEWVPNPDQKNFQLTGDEVDGIKSALDQNRISAQLQTEFSNHGMALTNAATALVIQNGEEWTITDGTTNYYVFYETDKTANKYLYIYQFETAWENNLTLLAKEVSAEQPAVAVINIVNNPTTGIPAAVLPVLCSAWFNTNIGQFNHVFASLDLSPILAKTDVYKWIKPTGSSYAVTDDGTLETSVFGMLTMALNDPPGTNHQVSPYAIPSGSDAGFLISGPMFVQNMLLAGARAVFNNAPASSFTITNDGLTVQNTEDMIWGKFMMDNKKLGSIAAGDFPSELDQGNLSVDLRSALEQIDVFRLNGYSATVTSQGSQWLLSNGQTGDKEYILDLSGSSIDVWIATAVTVATGQFKMTLVHTYVEIEFVDLKYSYSSDFDVHINYTEQVQLTLKDVGSGKQVFWFDQIMKNLTVNVNKTQSAITREIVEGAVMAAISLVAIAGPIVDGLIAAARIGEVTEDAGEALLSAQAFADVADASPEADAANEISAAGDAAEQAGGKLTAIKNAFCTPKWKFVGALAALAGVGVASDKLIDAIIENAAKNKWENVPGFDEFADILIKPYTFPNVSGFSLNSAWLAGSLQIGLKTR